MSNIFSKICKAAIVFASIFVILPGCNFNSQFTGHAVAKEPAKISVWLAYWDLDAGGKELDKIDNLTQVSYFAAYFDKDDHLFVPQELSDKKSELNKKKRKYESYLTFVNDKVNPDGSMVMKDLGVLRRLFANDDAMDKHIDEIIEMTLRGGYDGIEIDYEKMWKDDNIGQAFVRFTDKLYVKAQKNKLKLRTILEPRTPFSTAGFSQGPEYVVMLYNLYGLHSSPGPKANKEFIQKVLTKMKALPGEKSVAISTGGCKWGDNGTKSFLTEAEARALLASYGDEIKRDEDSQCVVFDYKDKAGVSYQVWYADVKTLNYWITNVKEQGVNNISLWRLGGNINLNKIR